MRKLQYTLNMGHLRQIKEHIVPAIFTEHQFGLMEKKAAGQNMTNSEKNEFSRAVSRKMNAINAMMEKETGGVFVYGEEKMIENRLEKAKKHLKGFSRKFKGKHILISGSFLYSEEYNDIDVFVVSKYEKEDYREGRFHINYLTEDVYGSLFFASMKRLCVSSRTIREYEITEKADIDTFISLYQELFGDIDKKFEGIRSTLRDFLLQAACISKSPIPDSLELRQKIDLILNSRKLKEIIKKIFVDSVILGIEPNEAINAMKDMILSYEDIMGEYKQHKEYYLDLIQAFKEVISIES